jgi:hypothetical protein
MAGERRPKLPTAGRPLLEEREKGRTQLSYADVQRTIPGDTLNVDVAHPPEPDPRSVVAVRIVPHAGGAQCSGLGC